MARMLVLWSISVVLISLAVIYGPRLLALSPVNLTVVDIVDLGYALKAPGLPPKTTPLTWTLIQVKVENRGNQPVRFDGFNVVDGENIKFKHHTDMSQYLPGICQPQLIEAGGTATCADVFELPESAELTVQFAGAVVPLQK